MDVTISKAKSIVETVIKNSLSSNGTHSPMFLHSSPGIGKSAVVKQITNDLGIGFIDVRVSQMESSDLAGIPHVIDGEMRMSVPSWFPTQDKIDIGVIPESGIIFFDELSNAPIPSQHAAYRIIHDREVHNDTVIPPKWVVIAAGNLKEDKTGAKGVTPALANRFAIHLTIRPDLDDFRSYAVGKGLRNEIIGFLGFDTSMLYNFDPKKADVSFATPRSWEQVSNILNMGFSGNDLSIAIGGCVGDAATAQFMSFIKYYEDLPNFEDIMTGKNKYKVPVDGDRGILFAVTSSIITNLVSNAMDAKRVQNLDKVMNQLPDDFVIMIYKTLKSSATDESIQSIVINTMKTYKKISKYV